MDHQKPVIEIIIIERGNVFLSLVIDFIFCMNMIMVIVFIMIIRSTAAITHVRGYSLSPCHGSGD